jgi:hypothetical protein
VVLPNNNPNKEKNLMIMIVIAGIVSVYLVL